MMIYWTYAGLMALTMLCAALITFGLGRIMTLAQFSAGRRKVIMVAVPLATVFWLLYTGMLAHSGFLADWDARPPRLPLIPLAALVSIAIMHNTALLRTLMQATPRHWPVALQTFRIGVELSFWGLFLAGGAPPQVTFEGRNFDVLVGLSAPLIALAIVKIHLGPRIVIAWNLLGLAILSNTIFTTLTSMPGPIHRNWPGMPFTAFGHAPFVWIPAFLAPLAIFLHVVSIRQNLALFVQNKSA